MSSLPTEPDEVEAHRMPLMEHLIELRNRVVYSAVALAVGMVICLFIADDLFAFLKAPFVVALTKTGVKGGLSIVNSPFEGVYTYLRVSFVGGLMLAMPVVAYQIWRFIAPGLYKTERRVVLPLAFSSTMLFTGGSAFAYYVILPVALPFFLEVIEADANLSLSGYLSGVVRMMVAFGICFQLPVVTWFIARIGLIDHRDMVESFRYAVVGMFVVAALITPPDVLTQSLLAIPLVILYVISIGIAWVFTTKTR
jgi:sec-independent protein translocase protein TatC